METGIKVLHIDTEMTWRGGQQQAIYLHEGLVSRNIKSLFICNPGSELFNYCSGNSLPVVTIRMRGEADIIAAWKIARFAASRDYNILHCHSAHALSIGLLAKFFNKKVYLVGVRRVDFHTGKNIFSKIKYASSAVDRIVCISEKIRNILIEDGLRIEKLETIRSGIDLTKFVNSIADSSFRDEFGISDDTTIVGTVAAFVGHKDYNNFIDAAEIVLRSNKSVIFAAVGDGVLFNVIKERARQIGISGNIIFTGYRKDVGRLLKSFDIFVLASKKEGLGTSILDAQALGLPVIATRTGGIPEIITHDKNGILVDPKNPGQLAESIIELLNNKEKRLRLGLEAKSFAGNFDIRTTIDKNIDMYKNLTAV